MDTASWGVPQRRSASPGCPISPSSPRTRRAEGPRGDLRTRGAGATCWCRRHVAAEGGVPGGSRPRNERSGSVGRRTAGTPSPDITSGLVAYLDGEPVGCAPSSRGPRTTACCASTRFPGRDETRQDGRHGLGGDVLPIRARLPLQGPELRPRACSGRLRAGARSCARGVPDDHGSREGHHLGRDPRRQPPRLRSRWVQPGASIPTKRRVVMRIDLVDRRMMAEERTPSPSAGITWPPRATPARWVPGRNACAHGRPRSSRQGGRSCERALRHLDGRSAGRRMCAEARADSACTSRASEGRGDEGE